MAPIEREQLSYEKADPLSMQIANFCGVIRGTADPVVSGSEGLKTLSVIDAIKRAAETEISCRFDTGKHRHQRQGIEVMASRTTTFGGLSRRS
ncbi:hypothetical protein [Bradyrhizobium sp. CB2312]|uniref:hypothetical protein n=1 Tax=Bradyrhizobium sp. CB2312 TaxID=3039155 RepID=UPI0024B1ED3A|nr:hypothetical protein [Bradyrhizobium sp. CB2312]WFU69239.1 hypothetical protein QA642_28545 [Bradyrhizobium sp. CB2312]